LAEAFYDSGESDGASKLAFDDEDGVWHQRVGGFFGLVDAAVVRSTKEAALSVGGWFRPEDSLLSTAKTKSNCKPRS